MVGRTTIVPTMALVTHSTTAVTVIMGTTRTDSMDMAAMAVVGGPAAADGTALHRDTTHGVVLHDSDHVDLGPHPTWAVDTTRADSINTTSSVRTTAAASAGIPQRIAAAIVMATTGRANDVAAKVETVTRTEAVAEAVPNTARSLRAR